VPRAPARPEGVGPAHQEQPEGRTGTRGAVGAAGAPGAAGVWCRPQGSARPAPSVRSPEHGAAEAADAADGRCGAVFRVRSWMYTVHPRPHPGFAFFSLSERHAYDAS